MKRQVMVLLAGLALAGCQRSPAGADAPSAPAAREGGAPSGAARQAPRRAALPGTPFDVPLSFSAPLSGPTPISSGVPIPRGALGSIETLQLLQGGQPALAQFTPLAAWPDGSVKAVLVSTVAAPQGTLVLRNAPGGALPAPPSPLTVEESADRITVTTGPLRFSVARARFRFFEEAWIDQDTDGAFTDAERVIGRAGDVALVSAGDPAGEFRLSRAKRAQATIEERGPARVVIRAQGALRSASGAALGDAIVWLTAFAGSDQVMLDVTLVDPREEANVDEKPNEPPFAASAYTLELPVAVGEDGRGLFGGDAYKRVVAYAGPVTGPVAPYLYQQGVFNFVNGALKPFSFWYEGVGQGAKADGWFDASDARGGVAIVLRRFWEQFPKELSIDRGMMRVHFHPARASLPGADHDPLGLPEPEEQRYRRRRTFYFPRTGGAKTYQLLLQFHRGAGDAHALKALHDTFQARPRLVPSPAWLSRSQAFGNLLESGPWSQGYDDWLVNGIYSRSIERKRDTGGLAQLYGWRDYGDRLRPGWADIWNGKKIPAWYNDTHVGAHNFLIQYIRTGDERWYDLGEQATRHWMDIDVSHANRLGHWKRGGKPVGYGPGEGYMIKHEMIDHDCRNVHWGHAHLSGLAEYYLLTGDSRAREVLHEVGAWWAAAARDFYKTPIGKKHYAEAERDYAWPLFVLTQAYRATGERRYLEGAAQIVRHLIEWWQMPSDHYVNGEVVGRNDWRQGTGWWHMYPRQDNSPEPPKGKILYNGTNPWMAGPLLGSIIQFHELDRDHHLVDDALTEEMLLQCMNYVVKYGWNEAKRFFIYSEASRDTRSDGTHLVFPLAYLAKLLRDHPRPHPEWYDTADRWAELARTAAPVHGRRDSSDAGFYGYEFIFPADFFAALQELDRPASAPGAAADGP